MESSYNNKRTHTYFIPEAARKTFPLREQEREPNFSIYFHPPCITSLAVQQECVTQWVVFRHTKVLAGYLELQPTSRLTNLFMFNNVAYSVSARFRSDSTIIIAQWKYNSELSCFTFVGHFSHLGRPPALHKHQVDPRHAGIHMVLMHYQDVIFSVSHTCVDHLVFCLQKKWMFGIPTPGVQDTIFRTVPGDAEN